MSRCQCIVQPERHDIPLKKVLFRGKRQLRGGLSLSVPLANEPFGIDVSFQGVLDAWERVSVSDGVVVEYPEIHTKVLSPFLFTHHND